MGPGLGVPQGKHSQGTDGPHPRHRSTAGGVREGGEMERWKCVECNVYTIILQMNIMFVCVCVSYILSLELGVIGGVITSVHSLMLGWSSPVYQVRLDWLPICLVLP